MDKLLYGAAYYEEYLPYGRLQQDVGMMKAAGINVVRIAESTWSTCEPQDGVFDFSHVVRVIDAMEEAGIGVVIGTPTYAVPAWMVKKHPEILAETKAGRNLYGPRQNMDITNPDYLFYAERAIRKLMECTAHRKGVIGFQLDNETKSYGTSGKNVQKAFVAYLKKEFGGSLEEINRKFGLDYWSNRINSWEEFPDIRGTINGSLGAQFQKFQRKLVTEFLSWQAGIVREYKREGQFITHNFDFEWRGHSYGVQPEVDQFKAAKCMDIAGADIYHPSQDSLTGEEIAFGGDLIRSVKGGNYLIMETQAQGFPGWTPYKGQLRLQAYSHIASGANSVMYWHWHSLHNAVETYWKGLLSHDFAENEAYLEAKCIGAEFHAVGSHLVNLKKQNKVAILVSNESLTALEWFPVDADPANPGKIKYNDIVRWVYNSLYRMNVECDFLSPESEGFENYALILVPALYAAPEPLLRRLNAYVAQGGHLFVTFKSAFADEYVKVSHHVQPAILGECLGVEYHQFAFPKEVRLKSDYYQGMDGPVHTFMELLVPKGAKALASYCHQSWGGYAAVTRNHYGKGTATYLGCMLDGAMLSLILEDVLDGAGISRIDERFPVIVRKGKNGLGKEVVFYLNYSGTAQRAVWHGEEATDLLSGDRVGHGEEVLIEPWGLRMIEA
jgi:beta-galactosidase